MKKWTFILLVAVVALAVVPLLIASDAEWGGADSGGQEAITELAPDFTPGFEGVWAQSETTNYIMFGVQGVVGAGILFSVLGYLVGRTRGRAEAAGEHQPLRTGVIVTYLVIAAVALAVVPVIYYVVGYKPPSGEIICLFFALEGAIASGFLFFGLTYLRGRNKGRKQLEDGMSAAAGAS